jgi:hypothetical protein
MSYQSYLDNIEKQTGKTPNEIIAMAHKQGFSSESKSSEVVAWLKTELGIGHGHAMAMAGVIKNGSEISSKHVGTSGSHSDESTTLRLDGLENR